MENYIVITALTLDTLKERVNARYREGYRPIQGFNTYIEGGKLLFAQPMELGSDIVTTSSVEVSEGTFSNKTH